MATQKNATYKVHNGTDYDEINFKTIASQVKMLSGVDLESGFSNNKDTNGYTKLPSGLIIQWGTLWTSGITAGSSVSGAITLPIRFPNKGLSLVVSAELARDPSGNNIYTAKFYPAGCYFTTPGTFDYKVQGIDYISGSAVCNYIAIGY